MKLLENIQNYDTFTFYWCSGRKNHVFMIHIARLISKTADGHLYAIIGLLLLIQYQYKLCLLFASAFCIERCLYFILKNSCRRKRPPEALPDFTSIIEPGDQFSFPSGHTSAAFLTATLLSELTPFNAVFFFSWAASAGISRVVLGVHFPTDTLAGAILGKSLAQATLVAFTYL